MRYTEILEAAGFDLFREQVFEEYNRLSKQLGTNKQHVVARARHVVRQTEHWAVQPDLTEEEEFWLEVIKESFEELAQKAGG
jgi:hypothetical protein